MQYKILSSQYGLDVSIASLANRAIEATRLAHRAKQVLAQAGEDVDGRRSFIEDELAQYESAKENLQQAQAKQEEALVRYLQTALQAEDTRKSVEDLDRLRERTAKAILSDGPIASLLRGLNERIIKLEEEIESKTNALNTSTAQLHDLKSNFEKSQSEIRQLTSKNAQAELQLATLSGYQQSYEKASRALEEKGESDLSIQKLQNEIVQLQAQIRSFEGISTRYEAVLKEKSDLKISGLESESLRSENDRLTQALTTAQKENEKLTRAFNIAMKRLLIMESLAAEQSEKLAQFGNLGSQLASTHHQIEALKKENQSLRIELLSSRTSIEALSKGIDMKQKLRRPNFHVLPFA